VRDVSRHRDDLVYVNRNAWSSLEDEATTLSSKVRSQSFSDMATHLKKHGDFNIVLQSDEHFYWKVDFLAINCTAHGSELRPIHTMRHVSVPSEWSVFTLSVLFSHLPE
jgi:hypothetical protein